jgi:hypothetical protein
MRTAWADLKYHRDIGSFFDCVPTLPPTFELRFPSFVASDILQDEVAKPCPTVLSCAWYRQWQPQGMEAIQVGFDMVDQWTCLC